MECMTEHFREKPYKFCLLILFGCILIWQIININQTATYDPVIDAIKIKYEYTNAKTNRLVACENGGVVSEGWIECVLSEGTNSILEIPLIKGQPLEAFFVEIRKASEEDILSGELYISEVSFWMEGVSVYSYSGKEQLERLFGAAYGSAADGICYVVSEKSPQLIFNSACIDNVRRLSRKISADLFLKRSFCWWGGVALLCAFIILEIKKEILSGFIKNALVPFAVKHPIFVSWFLAFLLIGKYFWMSREIGFRGDAYEMWEVGKTYFSKGEKYHSFVEYRSPLCFMILGMLYNLTQILGINDVGFYRILSMFQFSILSAVLLPELLAGKEEKGTKDVRKRVSLVLVMYYFFRGYFLMPFTDSWGLFFLILAMLNLKKYFMLTEEGSRLRYSKTPLWGAVFALEMHVAIAFRSSYFMTFIAVFVMFFYYMIRYWNKNGHVCKLLIVYCTVFLISYISFGKIFHLQTNRGVFGAQLIGAFTYAKAEFSVQGTLLFSNTIGEYLFSHGLDRQWWQGITDLSDYVKFSMSHIGYMIAMAAKGAFNGLDICYDSIIIFDLEKGKVLHMLLNYLFLFIAAQKAAYKLLVLKEKNLIWLFILLLNALPYSLGMVEVRFFMPMLAGLYAVACFYKFPFLWYADKKSRRRSLSLLAIHMGLCICLHMHTWEHIL